MFHLLVHGSAHVDRDTTGLHCLRNLPDQLDLQQTVLEGRAAHVDVVGQVELPAERPRGPEPVCANERRGLMLARLELVL